MATSLALAAVSIASVATAQTHVGRNVEGGIPWSVAAPQGANWSLVCRFAPVTYEASRYDLRRWTNKIATRGAGAARGRLPLQDGSCTVTKTGGPGPVAIAMVRGDEVVSDAASETGQTAAVGFL
ncbi:hypothetical protein [Brevundimonas sp. NIBR11]|uniref:hypothetical protein n=1 Tax=Brevundimonas sp. NIBR11 TaxID=3015999 RepID=UPI0022F0DEA1|nr:hypothetical protein [Brevundimonas sp. NIBR11]